MREWEIANSRVGLYRRADPFDYPNSPDAAAAIQRRSQSARGKQQPTAAPASRTAAVGNKNNSSSCHLKLPCFPYRCLCCSKHGEILLLILKSHPRVPSLRLRLFLQRLPHLHLLQLRRHLALQEPRSSRQPPQPRSEIPHLEYFFLQDASWLAGFMHCCVSEVDVCFSFHTVCRQLRVRPSWGAPSLRKRPARPR